MEQSLVPIETSNTALTAVMTAAGQAANEAAAHHLFAEYQQTKSANTLKRQQTDLNLFASYLNAASVPASGDWLIAQPKAWAGVSWGLVKGFVAWQLQEGYAVSSANMRLATVRVYARLAAQAGFLSSDNSFLITAVKGYSRKEGRNIDEKRPVKRKGEISYQSKTRQGKRMEVTREAVKKVAPVVITDEVAKRLKTEHANTPSGRRNKLILCLLLDHGLRADEVAGLVVGDVSIKEGELCFYRPKVDKVSRHKLTADTLSAAQQYLALNAAAEPDKPLFRPSRKGGQLVEDTTQPIDRIDVSRLVHRLGKRLAQEKGLSALTKLSAHDCRHFCATDMARKGYDVKHLMQWFGWSSPAMAMRYVAEREVVVRDKG